MISPMTTWLKGHRSRKCDLVPLAAPMMSGHVVLAVLRERGSNVAHATGQTVEEAMANALNALMAREGTEDANEKDRG